MRVDIDFSFHIKWVYDKGVGLIWKDSIPEWETQKSESQKEEQ